MVKFYSKLSEMWKNVFILSAITVVVFLALCPFFLFSNPGVPLGWLLGSVIEIAAYISIIYGSKFLLASTKKRSAIGFTVLFFSGRMIFYAGGLVLGALCTFYWKNDWINVFSVAAAYLPMVVLVMISNYAKSKKEENFVKPVVVSKPKESSNPEESKDGR